MISTTIKANGEVLRAAASHGQETSRAASVVVVREEDQTVLEGTVDGCVLASLILTEPATIALVEALENAEEQADSEQEDNG